VGTIRTGVALNGAGNSSTPLRQRLAGCEKARNLGFILRQAQDGASAGSWFETAFGLLTMRSRVFNGLALMVSLSNHEQRRFSEVLLVYWTPLECPFTSQNMRTQKEARAHLRRYCPIPEPWTGASSHQGSSQHSARTRWKDDRAADTRHAVGASIFAIEPPHQSRGPQSSPRQPRALPALCSPSSMTPYYKPLRCQNNNWRLQV
jgi:hypothetical protein